ncbi:MAG TPA: alpha-L-fucosidase [Verrucomicrobiae bacterium]|nr:alpha-L-fucosidase [Verrucomicrobiae bacterium]
MRITNGLKHLIFIAIGAIAGVIHAEPPSPHDTRLAWWRDARFGMFIHWGPVSLTGQEISWSRANSNTNSPNHGATPAEVYDNLYKRFNPTNFNANEWVDIAKSSGMKYMVLTAKHGDGFLLWDSKVDGYNIGATPFHRDVCAELAEAAHRQNEKLGWYFSPMDWRDPDCRSANNDRFVKRIQAELRELLSNYGRIDVLWFDTDGRPAMWDPANTQALVHKLQPQMLVNNRLEMSTHEQWVHQGRLAPGEDFHTPEQTIGAYDDQTPWETCMTLGTQWSWKPDDKIKTAGEVIRILAQCAGGDGNLLLDVGPMPDGRIEPRQVEVLKQAGAWLDKNGESIYGTRGGPWKPTKAIASTRRGNVIYVHVLRGDTGSIDLPGIARKIKSASILNGGKLKFRQDRETLTLEIPLDRHDAGDTIVKLELDGSAMDLPAVPLPEPFKATASNVFQNDSAAYGPQCAFDDDDQTRWATDPDARQSWLAVDFLKPRTVDHVRIIEAYPDRVQRFELQFRAGKDWKTILTGTTLGDNYQKPFAPVTAQEFRLNILDATNGPTITGIELQSR